MGLTFQYFKQITRHRRNVAHYCFMCHEYKRGIFHDISKFFPSEFTECAAYYNEKHSPIDISRRLNGYSMAWLKHKGRNDHHYEYWIDDFDHGGRAIRMPYHQTIEMLCDYLGENKTIDKKTFTYTKHLKFWEDKTNPNNDMLMHEDTEKMLTIVFESLAQLEEKYHKYSNDNRMMSDGWAKKNILNEKRLTALYDAITEHNDDKIENIQEQMTTI